MINYTLQFKYRASVYLVTLCKQIEMKFSISFWKILFCNTTLYYKKKNSETNLLINVYNNKNRNL